MAFLPEDQKTRLKCYRAALQKWNIRGYVEYKRIAAEWLRVEVMDYPLDEIKQLLWKYVESDGKIAETVETRENYTSYQFHYDLRVPIDGRRIYFETILRCEDENDEDSYTILIVNAKDV